MLKTLQEMKDVIQYNHILDIVSAVVFFHGGGMVIIIYSSISSTYSHMEVRSSHLFLSPVLVPSYL